MATSGGRDRPAYSAEMIDEGLRVLTDHYPETVCGDARGERMVMAMYEAMKRLDRSNQTTLPRSLCASEQLRHGS